MRAIASAIATKPGRVCAGMALISCWVAASTGPGSGVTPESGGELFTSWTRGRTCQRFCAARSREPLAGGPRRRRHTGNLASSGYVFRVSQTFAGNSPRSGWDLLTLPD